VTKAYIISVFDEDPGSDSSKVVGLYGGARDEMVVVQRRDAAQSKARSWFFIVCVVQWRMKGGVRGNLYLMLAQIASLSSSRLINCSFTACNVVR
jgi:hypothetical protein